VIEPGGNAVLAAPPAMTGTAIGSATLGAKVARGFDLEQ
jgi:hypothetical protein